MDGHTAIQTDTHCNSDRQTQAHIAIQTDRCMGKLRFRQTDTGTRCSSDRQKQTQIAIQTDTATATHCNSDRQTQPHIAIQTDRHRHIAIQTDRRMGNLRFRHRNTLHFKQTDTQEDALQSKHRHGELCNL